MKIAVTGGTGLVGSALVPHLRAAGHEVLRLVRGRPSAADEISLGSQGLAGRPRGFGRRGRGGASRRRADRRRAVERRAQGADPPEPGRRHPLPGPDPGRRCRRSRRCWCRLRRSASTATAARRSWTRRARSASASCRRSAGSGRRRPSRRGQAGIRVVHPRLGMVLAPSGGALQEDAAAVPAGPRRVARIRRAVGAFRPARRIWCGRILFIHLARRAGRSAHRGGPASGAPARFRRRAGPRAESRDLAAHAGLRAASWLTARWRRSCCWPPPGWRPGASPRPASNSLFLP